MLQNLIIMENASHMYNTRHDFAIVKGTESIQIKMEIINLRLILLGYLPDQCDVIRINTAV